MSIQKLKEFLDSQNVKYVSVVHSPAYTAQEIAAEEHISGDEYEKAVYLLLGKVERNRLKLLDLEIVNDTPRLQTHRDLLLFDRRKHPELDFADLLQFSVIRESFLKYLTGESTPRLVTADEKLADAARAEGLEVLEVNNDV